MNKIPSFVVKLRAVTSDGWIIDIAKFLFPRNSNSFSKFGKLGKNNFCFFLREFFFPFFFFKQIARENCTHNLFIRIFNNSMTFVCRIKKKGRGGKMKRSNLEEIFNCNRLTTRLFHESINYIVFWSRWLISLSLSPRIYYLLGIFVIPWKMSTSSCQNSKKRRGVARSKLQLARVHVHFRVHCE